MDSKIGASASWPLAIALAVIQGCSALQEPGMQIPTGSPIPTDQIPAHVVPPDSLPDGTKAQRLEGGEMYRLDLPDGTTIYAGPNGIADGGVL